MRINSNYKRLTVQGVWFLYFIFILTSTALVGCVTPMSDGLTLIEVSAGTLLIALLGSESIGLLLLMLKKPAFVLTIFVVSKMFTSSNKSCEN